MLAGRLASLDAVIYDRLFEWRGPRPVVSPIVIAAIEDAHPRLAQLIAPPQGSGGTLFQQRSSRVVRTVDGPLTALNVRLFEDDYDIIDRLVAQYGAFSRGHLITAALTNYLTD